MKYICSGLLALVLLGLAPLGALGADDAYTAGYVAAVLEREFNINPRSLKVKDGIVTIDADDLPRADRPKIVTALSAVQGVTRVELLEAGQRAPAGSPVAGPAAEIGAGEVPQLLVYNKIDMTGAAPGVEKGEYGKVAYPQGG